MSAYPSDLAAQIGRQIEGEVRFDRYSRVLYSTDASVWQIEPIGAVIPRHHGDVRSLVQLCSKHRVPVLARGGATSLSGQTVGEAVHIDFAKYMNGILETNLEEGWVRIQPGVVQDQLGRHLRPLGYQFGPNTSSASRGTVGGMIGNNSAGSHSILYGKTIDHVLELRCVFADGSEAWLKPVANGDLEALGRGDDLVASLYRQLPQIGAQYREEILTRFPRILRRVSGYNLDELVRDGETPSARAIPAVPARSTSAGSLSAAREPWPWSPRPSCALSARPPARASSWCISTPFSLRSTPPR